MSELTYYAKSAGVILLSVAISSAIILPPVLFANSNGRESKEILVCSSPLGETVPGGKGYAYVWFEDGAWKLEDDKRQITTYTPVPGEMCRTEPLQIVEEN